MLEKTQQRLQEYLDLIEKLLSCSSDREVARVLQANQQLIDKQLIAAMQYQAQASRKKGNHRAADFLIQIANRLAQQIGFSMSPQEEFRWKLLKITAESKGDSQIVYQFLEANLDKLDDNFADILRNWATAKFSESELELEAAQYIAGNVVIFSRLVHKFPLGDRGINIEIAIAGYEVGLIVLSKKDFPEEWAEIQLYLGNAYDERIRGDRKENVENAISHFTLAFSVYTREDYPREWAMTQNALGTAYNNRVLGNKAQNLENAITSYTKALEVFTKEDYPSEWATVLTNLGAIYGNRIRGNKAKNLESSIGCYTLALKTYTKENFPSDWARIQMNLGGAYFKRIRGNKAQNLENAINHLSLALEVFTKENFPDKWAMTQNNLGNAYWGRINGNKAQNLENAINHLTLALEVLTKENFPINWEAVQHSLGNAYLTRICGNKTKNLESAIRYYILALEVCTKESFPLKWAKTQLSLGIAYCNRILGDRSENQKTAIHCCSLALEILTKEDFPVEWATTQNNLGEIYRNRVTEDRERNIENAITAYTKASEVYTKEDFPYEWAVNQMNLGLAYFERIHGNKAKNLENAIGYLTLALEVFTKENFPLEWARTQLNLGIAYSGNKNLQSHIFSSPSNIHRTENFENGDMAENLENAICHLTLALEVHTKKDLPHEWALTNTALSTIYLERICGDRKENVENAIDYLTIASLINTKEDFPFEWAMTQMNLGIAYKQRISGRRTENIKMAIAFLERALSVYTPEAYPTKCLGAASSLGYLHFDLRNWQSAIDAYKQAITAVELIRSWSQDDDRRQEILKEMISVYAEIVQCFVNIRQYPQAFEYAERYRSRQLVDLMASKDLYHQGEIPPEVEELLQQFDTLERQIDRLRFPNPSQGDRNDTRKRAAWEATNEEIAKLEAEKQQVYRQIRQLDRVLAEQIQVAPLDFPRLQQLIEDDTTAILSFYSTLDDTHAFIVRRSGVDLHTCLGQGAPKLQKWLQDNWLKPYADVSYLPGFIAAAQLLGCEVEAIKSLEPGETEITVLLKDGTSHTANKSQFEELRKLEKAWLINNWQQQMPEKLAEIARRLEIDKLTDQLKGIQELILIPHLLLHQIPFAALPLASGQYLGDKYLIRTLASCQVLDFCRQRPPLATQSPTYGIVEDSKQDLPCATYEGRQIAQMYGVADSQYLKGSQATVRQYKQLLPQVERLLSSHHAQSRLDNNLESALILADGRITLGQLLSPAYRFPNLDEVFLSCCETNLGLTDVSDNMMTLNTGFLCAGARGAVSTLWSVNDLATSLFSIFYHHQRQAGKNRPQALQHAQQQLRQLTGKEFKKKYRKELEKVLTEKLEEAYKSMKEVEQQRDLHAEESPEYNEWEKQRVKRALLYDRIGELKNKGLKEAGKKEHPFAELQYWSGFICAGLR